MKIYTKRGDTGETDLIGKRVKKSDYRIMFNGSVDEAMAFLTYTIFYLGDEEKISDLKQIYKTLQTIAHEIALDKEPLITLEHVNWIESRIDYYNNQMEPLNRFITFDGNKSAAVINITRTVVRRTERELIKLEQHYEINPHINKYLNRLSDYLFVIGRQIEGK